MASKGKAQTPERPARNGAPLRPKSPPPNSVSSGNSANSGNSALVGDTPGRAVTAVEYLTKALPGSTTLSV